MTSAAARAVRAACGRARRHAARGDSMGTRAALLDALGWLAVPPVSDPVRIAIAAALADGCPWSDEELAMVARCPVEYARVIRACIERGAA